MPICQNCDKEFPNRMKIDNKFRNLSSRKFCPACSPIDSNNTRSYIVELKENEAYCPRCNEIKNKNDFYVRKNNKKPFSYCIECQKQVKNIKFQEKLERVVEERSGVCVDCGICYPITVYEFYSEEKGKYQLSKTKNMSLMKVKDELKNYVMLCLNCCAIRRWEKDN